MFVTVKNLLIFFTLPKKRISQTKLQLASVIKRVGLKVFIKPRKSVSAIVSQQFIFFPGCKRRGSVNIAEVQRDRERKVPVFPVLVPHVREHRWKFEGRAQQRPHHQ